MRGTAHSVRGGSFPPVILPSPLALAAAAPWAVIPGVVAWRALDGRSLDEEEAALPLHAPMVSIIVPARNEARNIERCVRSILGTGYEPVEVIVVDDGSTDGTGELARTAGFADARLSVISPPPLPDGWFGKQWACHTAAQMARGELLLFTDADTWHAPDLLARLVRARAGGDFAMLSVAGWQEMETFWERVVLPVPFFFLALLLGGTGAVERTRNPRRAIANGQCFMVTRTAYDAAGGHAAVRDNVAEDLRIAQMFVASGQRVGIRMGLEQLRTRMYASLAELIGGWGKNVYAGGKYFFPDHPVARVLYACALVLGPLVMQAPIFAIVAAATGVAPAWMGQAGVIAFVAQTAWSVIAYAGLRLPLWYGLLHPLGTLTMAWIGALAVWRGDRVRWKGRTYTSR
jgi:chlorobactene glucosyltransferase